LTNYPPGKKHHVSGKKKKRTSTLTQGRPVLPPKGKKHRFPGKKRRGPPGEKRSGPNVSLGKKRTATSLKEKTHSVIEGEKKGRQFSFEKIRSTNKACPTLSLKKKKIGCSEKHHGGGRGIGGGKGPISEVEKKKKKNSEERSIPRRKATPHGPLGEGI